MDTEQNKAIYRRFIEEGFNNGQLATLDEVLARDYVDHDAPPGTIPGPEGIKQIVTMFRAAFPDLHITIEEQVAERDLVTSRSVFRGTHRGELFGIAPTGRAVTMKGLSMVRIANGQITDTWLRNDVMSLMQQLGASPGGA
ncbi:MAG: ester cyclase [Dehalococcoidia bacterium]